MLLRYLAKEITCMKQHWYSYAIPPGASVFHCDVRELATCDIRGQYDYCIIENAEYSRDLDELFKRCREIVAPHGRVVITWRVWWLQWGFWRRILPIARLNANLLASRASCHGYSEITRDIPVSGYCGSLLRLIPVLRALYPWRYLVLAPQKNPENYSVTVIIPCKNERGTIAAAVERLPIFGCTQEILFADGNSTDGTHEEIARIQTLYNDRTIRMITQTGRGKKNGVFEGIAAAQGEVIILLDSDLAIAPEEMPKFYDAIARGDGEMINGARFVYPMERDATPRLNFVANLVFPMIISRIIKQRISDSLCGTKVFFKKDFEIFSRAPSVWGIDPFGDFTFLFAWGRAWKRIVDVPVHHHARSYGETRIHRFSAGWSLLFIVLRAALCWTRFR